jgi:hypothetical protein
MTRCMICDWSPNTPPSLFNNGLSKRSKRGTRLITHGTEVLCSDCAKSILQDLLWENKIDTTYDEEERGDLKNGKRKVSEMRKF